MLVSPNTPEKVGDYRSRYRSGPAKNSNSSSPCLQSLGSSTTSIHGAGRLGPGATSPRTSKGPGSRVGGDYPRKRACIRELSLSFAVNSLICLSVADPRIRRSRKSSAGLTPPGRRSPCFGVSSRLGSSGPQPRKPPPLLLPQCRDRIDLQRPPRGNVDRDRRCDHQHQRDGKYRRTYRVFGSSTLRGRPRSRPTSCKYSSPERCG